MFMYITECQEDRGLTIKVESPLLKMFKDVLVYLLYALNNFPQNLWRKGAYTSQAVAVGLPKNPQSTSKLSLWDMNAWKTFQSHKGRRKTRA